MPDHTPLGRIVITGGGAGLGAAVADAVAAGGGTPVVVDRVLPPGARHETHEADVSDTRRLEHVIAGIAADGGLDGLVTAAGIDRPGRLDHVAPDAWERVIAVNLLGTVAAVRAALPHLEASAGRVVTVASTLALSAVSDATAYCASKFGVLGFSRALAAETKGRVGVTTLIPGGMRTNFFDDREEQYRPGADARLSDPADVASAVVFALSRPPGAEIRELLVCHSEESSWP
ncbi:SDR family oxidoreductase [Agromyces aerolatus]|uniref:SDR family oxidoreductase n=1 Tax=Agromyces sp. LY-1074 TaxID=3074080 RepID=UPI00285DE417|nr:MULTISPECIES: SDR family oxidoreductase [unclassified Agromyces]MDR5700584.1 SDR family oxidoreductase [Agromyces sp. LY-1074]MDR5707105.1 SDR family oxidoreductase [Agromyces sp. LY-1358]